MKLSIESKVAIAVAAGFVALTIGVMAQGRSGGGTGGANGYGPMNNPGLSHMSSQGLQSSEFGRTTAEDARTKFSDTNTDETTVTTKGKKKSGKTLKSPLRKHVKTQANPGD
jgi:hypothetical protein